jgi:hypothetical protein
MMKSQTDKVSLWGEYPPAPKRADSPRPVATLVQLERYFPNVQSTRQNWPTLFVNILSRGSNWVPGETNALHKMEFSRQRASSRSRITGWGSLISNLPVLTGYVLVLISDRLKSVRDKRHYQEGNTGRFEEGSRGVSI